MTMAEYKTFCEVSALVRDKRGNRGNEFIEAAKILVGVYPGTYGPGVQLDYDAFRKIRDEWINSLETRGLEILISGNGWLIE